MLSVSGRRPTATRMTSTATSVRFDPSLLAIWKVTSFSPFFERLGVNRRRDERCDASLAEDARQLLADLRVLERHDPIERTRRGCTSAPKSRYMLAHSTPIAPAPTIATRPGTSPRVRASSLGDDQARRRGRVPGGCAGRYPVARMRSVGVRIHVPGLAAGHANAGRAGQRARCRAGQSPCSSSAGTRRRTRACRRPRRVACRARRSRG